MAPTAQDLQKLYGRVVLFVGIEAYHWVIGDFANAAKVARDLGADTLCVKRCDGSIRWYGNAVQARQERAAVLGQGVGYIPMLYSYGPKFSTQQIHDECACLIEMAQNNGDAGVLCDLETEWNGQVDAARVFEQIMRPTPLILGVTTWADPADQNWLGVAQAIAPAVNFWVPQRYDDWLAVQPVPAEETIIQPAVDLSQESGANNVAAIVQKIAASGGSAWLWEYTYAQSNPTLMQELSSTLHANREARDVMSGDDTSTIESPVSAPVEYEEYEDYVVTSADLQGGVAGLAARYGVSYADFCAANTNTIPDPDQLRSNQVVRVPKE